MSRERQIAVAAFAVGVFVSAYLVAVFSADPRWLQALSAFGLMVALLVPGLLREFFGGGTDAA